jgi:hypothetical protein
LRVLCHNAPIVRRLAVMLVPVAASAALAGCGKSAHLPASADTHASATRHSAPASHGGRASTKAQAGVLANALNLRASDLPGFAATGHKRATSRERALEGTLRTCVAGKAAAAPLAEASSDTFHHRGSGASVSLSSNVKVASTPALARAELRTMRGAHTRDCLKSFVGQLLARDLRGDASAKVVSIAKVAPPTSGTAGAFGWRISGGLVAGGAQIPFFIDLLGFDYGQANVTLFATSLPAPFPAGAEGQLFALLVDRAKTGGKGTLGKQHALPESTGPRQVEISL